MRDLVAMFVGAVLGTASRWLLDVLIPHTASQFPVSTLLINTLGSLALGFLVGGLWQRPGLPSWVKSGLGPGFLGTFTTFSAVVLAAATMTGAGRAPLAVLYVVVTFTAGLLAAGAGIAVGARLHDVRGRGSAP